MNDNFEDILAITELAKGELTDGELTFTAPEVFEAIKVSTRKGIAVLGVEIFEIRGEQYFTTNMSGYVITMSHWDRYMTENNGLAEEFARGNRLARPQRSLRLDDHISSAILQNGQQVAMPTAIRAL